MFQKILVAMALDHGVSQHTLQIANKLKNGDGEILALHVIEEPHGSANVRLREDMLTAGEERERDLFQEKLADHPDVHLMLARGHVSRTILDVAREEGADCIVMGSHKPGFADFLLGSNAARVVRHATCSVYVYRAAE